MKRKILSLALALMMIVSVVTALPVSAETDVNPIYINAIDTVSATSNYLYLTDSDKAKVPDVDLVDWATTGRVRLIAGNKTKATAVWETSDVIVSGSYEVFVAAARGTTSDAGIAADATVYVTVNGGAEQAATIKGTDTVTDVVSNSLGIYTLSADAVNTLQVAYDAVSGEPALSLYNFKLVKVDEPVVVNIPYNSANLIKTAAVSGSAYDKPDYAISARVNCDWATDGAVAIAGTHSGGFWESFIAPESCYYDVWVAIGAADACAGSRVVAWVGNTAVETTITANARTTAVGFNLGRIYIEEGQNKITVIVKNIRTSSSSLGLALYDARLEKSENQSESGECIIDASTFQPSAGVTVSPSFWTAVDDRAGWATDGYLHSSSLVGHTYTVAVPTAGCYNVYAAASTSTNGKISVSANDVSIVGADLADSNSAGSYNEVDSTYIGKIYLNEGSNTITMGTGANTTSYHLYNIKLELDEDLPEIGVIRITDANNNDISDATGGSKVYAEIATTEENASFFLAQYTGSDSTKTMVGTSYTADATPAYTVNGINYYRATLSTVASLGEVKAFLWKADETYAPLTATKSIGIN